MVKFWEDGNSRVRIFVGTGILQEVEILVGVGIWRSGGVEWSRVSFLHGKKGYMSALLSPHLGNAQITPPKMTPPPKTGSLCPPVEPCTTSGAPLVCKWEPHGSTHPKDGMALIPEDTY